MALQYTPSGFRMRELFTNLQAYGFLDFLLPALLIFVLMFGILQKANLFYNKEKGKDPSDPNRETDVKIPDRKINGIIAMTVSLIITIPHAAGLYPARMDPILMMYRVLPNTSVLLAVIFAVVLLFGLAGANFPNAIQLLFACAAAVLLVLMFMMNNFPGWLPAMDFLRDPTLQAILIIFLVAGVIFYVLIKKKSTEKLHKKVWRWAAVREPPKK